MNGSERGIEQVSLPQNRPSAPVPSDEHIPSYYPAERAFLLYIATYLSQRGDPPLESLYAHIEDITSTLTANLVFHAYDLHDVYALSDSKLGKIYDKKPYMIARHRWDAMQSLWLLWGDQYLQEATSFSKTLASKYLLPGIEAQRELQQRIYRKALGNVQIYEDRQLLREREDEILPLVETLFGPETRTTFARFYRLGEFRHSRSHGRSGNINLAEEDYYKINRAVMLGRAATDHITGVQRSWANMRGGKTVGYGGHEKEWKRTLRQWEIAQAIVET